MQKHNSHQLGFMRFLSFPLLSRLLGPPSQHVCTQAEHLWWCQAKAYGVERCKIRQPYSTLHKLPSAVSHTGVLLRFHRELHLFFFFSRKNETTGDSPYSQNLISRSF